MKNLKYMKNYVKFGVNGMLKWEIENGTMEVYGLK